MPKLNKVPTDFETEPMSTHLERVMEDVVMHASYPVFVCGVNRRVGLGNYEHLDVYSGLTIPMIGVLPNELEAFKQAVTDAATLGFEMVSTETWKRYDYLKNLQKSGRPEKAA